MDSKYRTWIDVRSTNRHNFRPFFDVFENFIWIAHRVKNWCIVVQIDDIAINGYSAW